MQEGEGLHLSLPRFISLTRRVANQKPDVESNASESNLWKSKGQTEVRSVKTQTRTSPVKKQGTGETVETVTETGGNTGSTPREKSLNYFVFYFIFPAGGAQVGSSGHTMWRPVVRWPTGESEAQRSKTPVQILKWRKHWMTGEGPYRGPGPTN